MNEPGRDRTRLPSSGSLELDDLVMACLDRFEREGRSALDDLCRQHPAFANDLRSRIHTLEAAGLIAVPEQEVPSAMPERLGDFRLLSCLGQGGMGVVYLAEQTSLGRQVALKLIRPEHLYFHGARERFRREVDAVARLSHPSIVPVYTVGEDKGIPFFAMEYVRGCSLHDVIRELKGRSPDELTGDDLRRVLAKKLELSDADEETTTKTSRLFQGGWVETVLRMVGQAAEALSHAHERGVLHRDLKPSNLMLTASGRVLLLDFGLAIGEGMSRLTKSGSQIGSLPYMPPEQVQGDLDKITARSDVYSLGVTFYELLTLHLPYTSDNSTDLMQRIVEGAPVAPRRLNPSLTWDVETVCLTAMDVEPGRRYAGAQALLRDIDNLLELRPIQARAASPLLKAQRFAQRHPAWSVGALLGLAAAIALPAVWVHQENKAFKEQKKLLDQVTEERDVAKRQTARAERNLDAAFEAVELMLTKVGDETLKDVPKMEGIRRDLLAGALHFFETLVEQRKDDPLLSLELGRAHARVGEIHEMLGSTQAADVALRQAVEIFDRACASPDPVIARQARRELVLVLSNLGNSAQAVGDFPSAEKSYERALAVAKELRETPAVASDAADPKYVGLRRSEASMAYDLGIVYRRTGRIEKAVDAFARALAAELEEVDASPGSAKVKSSAAVTAFELAELELQLNRPKDAAPYVAKSLELSEAALAQDPADPRNRLIRGRALITAAKAAKSASIEEATRRYREGLDLLKALSDDFPQVAQYRIIRATSEFDLGDMLLEAHDEAGAQVAYDDGGEEMRRLVDLDPENPTHRANLAYSFQKIAKLARVRSDRAAAERAAQDGVETAELALEKGKGAEPFQEIVAEMLVYQLDVESEGDPEFQPQTYVDRIPEVMRGTRIGLVLEARLRMRGRGEDPAQRALARKALDAAISQGAVAADLDKDEDFLGLREP